MFSVRCYCVQLELRSRSFCIVLLVHVNLSFVAIASLQLELRLRSVCLVLLVCLAFIYAPFLIYR